MNWSLWFRVHKDVFGLDTLFGIVYIPPEKSRYSSIDMFDEIGSQIIASTKEDISVRIMGDFNARCGKLNDVLSFDPDAIDLTNDFIEKQIGYEQTLLDFVHNFNHVSMDIESKTYGHRFVDMCKNMGLLIANSRSGKNGMLGKTTCSDASIVDYHVIVHLFF